MISNEAFQKLLYDLFCVWHDVRRHYDPPITDNEAEKISKVLISYFICSFFCSLFQMPLKAFVNL